MNRKIAIALFPFISLLILTSCSLPVINDYPKDPVTANQIAGAWVLNLPVTMKPTSTDGDRFSGVRDSHTQKWYPQADTLTLKINSNGTYSWTFNGPEKINYSNRNTTWKFSENTEQHQSIQLNHPRYGPEKLGFSDTEFDDEDLNILLNDNNEVILCYMEEDTGPLCFTRITHFKK